MTTDRERAIMLKLARDAAAAAAGGDRPPEIPDEECLKGGGGVFVTLKKEGRLRGCIGHFTGIGSVGDTIAAMAASAAVQDPRFPPVGPEEVKDLSISISLLSPMVSTDPGDVQPGVHGLYVKRGNRGGTLLPQVADEQGWDRETFLAHTCMKAGLPPNSWKDEGTEILTYTAEVFGEDSVNK